MQINPFDILSGKVVQTKKGTFWFRTQGYNIDSEGNIVSSNLHRENDLPAIEYKNGTKEWWFNGRLNRDNDLPAIEHKDGTKEWYWYGMRHRNNDLPAIEHKNGTKEWFAMGQHVRLTGPATVNPDGDKVFILNSGNMHGYIAGAHPPRVRNYSKKYKNEQEYLKRLKEIEVNDADLESGKIERTQFGVFWFKEKGKNIDENGKPIWENLHRIDGPAAFWRDGAEQWYVNGQWCSKKEYNEAVRNLQKQ